MTPLTQIVTKSPEEVETWPCEAEADQAPLLFPRLTTSQEPNCSSSGSSKHHQYLPYILRLAAGTWSFNIEDIATAGNATIEMFVVAMHY